MLLHWWGVGDRLLVGSALRVLQSAAEVTACTTALTSQDISLELGLKIENWSLFGLRQKFSLNFIDFGNLKFAFELGPLIPRFEIGLWLKLETRILKVDLIPRLKLEKWKSALEIENLG